MRIAITVTLMVSAPVAGPNSRLAALEDEPQMYLDQVGWNIAGLDPVASAAVDRIAVQPSGYPPSGIVEVLDWDGREWLQVGEDIIAGGIPAAMSTDGSRVAVSQPFDPYGWVKVFEWDGSDWSQLGGDIVGDVRGARFGRSVEFSADGDRMVVGAPVNPAGTGYVRVFEWDGTSWSQLGADLTGVEVDSGFGWSVTMADDGERVALSERPSWSSESFTDVVLGTVRVFDWDGAEWTQVGDDIDAVGEGVSFSASGERLAVGFEGEWDVGPVGRAWVFDLVAGNWEQVDYSVGRPATSVSLSADGTRLAYSGNNSNGPIDSPTGKTIIRDELASGWADVAVVWGLGTEELVTLSRDGDRMVIGGGGTTRVYDISASPFPPLASPVPLTPGRLYDSRAGAETVDGDMAGAGRRSAGTVTEIPVAGRGGVPVDALGVMLSVVAVGPSSDGHLTVYPCGASVPLSSNLNYTIGQTIANSVYTGLSTSGTVCVHTYAAIDLVVDVTGYAPLFRSALRPVGPSRLVDSRTGHITIGYETWVDVDRLQGGHLYEFSPTSVYNYPIPGPASALMLDVVAIDPVGDGFLTIYPCGHPRPLASSINYAAGQTIANLVFTGLGTNAMVCLYTSSTVDVVVDVTGFTREEGGLPPLIPSRLLDSRVGESTIDGANAGIGRRQAGSTTEVLVAGRGGVNPDATSAMLNVVAVNPGADGHLTIFPCGTEVPLASSLNYAAGQVIANATFTEIGSDGTVCIYTHAATDLVVDVTAAS